MFIKNIFEDYLKSSNSREQSAHTGYAKKFYISDMNKCFRVRYMKRLGVQVRYESMATLWNFALGNFVHAKGYEALRAAGVLLQAEEYVSTDHFVGRFDGIAKDIDNGNVPTLFDFKSVHPYAFKKAMARAEGKENIAQLLTYIMLKIKEDPSFSNRGLLVSINKLTDANLQEIIVDNDYILDRDIEKSLTAEMDNLTSYWVDEKVPPCNCEGWQAKAMYNEFYPFCTMGDLKIKEFVAKLKAGKIIVTSSTKLLEVVDGKDKVIKL